MTAHSPIGGFGLGDGSDVGHTIDERLGVVTQDDLAEAIVTITSATTLAEALAAACVAAVRITGMRRGIALVVDRRGNSDVATARDTAGGLDARLLADVRASVGRRGLVDAAMASPHSMWKTAVDLVVLHEPWLDAHDVRSVLSVRVPTAMGAAVIILASDGVGSVAPDGVAAVERCAQVTGAMLDTLRRLEREQERRRASEQMLTEFEAIGKAAEVGSVLRLAAEALERLTRDDAVAAVVTRDGRIDVSEVVGDGRHLDAIVSALEGERTLTGPVTGDQISTPAGRLLAIPLVPVGEDSVERPMGWLVSWSSSEGAVRRRRSPTVVDAALTLGRQTAVSLTNALRMRAERSALHRLEELDRLKSAFVASLSHGLRTPLTALVGYSELLAEESADDPRLAFAEDMRREAMQLETLIGNLLDASRLEAGMLHMNQRPLEVVAAVGDAVDAATHAAPHRAIELLSEVDRFVMVADAERLRQILAIVLDNALRYSPDHEPVDVRLSVTTEFCRDGRPHDGIRIDIDDRGPGIPIEHRSTVFERFARLHDDVDGTGIGLYLARALVRGHAGSIRINDRPGGGARISVWMPREPF